MKKLNVINVNGQYIADSREIAEMTGTRHDHLLAKIDGFYVVLATDPNFRVSDFFIAGTYEDSTGRTMKKYDCTRKGCDMIANKMTGKKGVLFTATYVTRFEELEKKSVESQDNVIPLDERRVRMELLKTAIDHDQRIENVEFKIEEISRKVEEQITLDNGEQRKVQKAIARKIYSIEQDKAVRRELFHQIYREIKDRWAVASYRDVRRTELHEVLDYVAAWKPINTAA